LTSRFVPGGSHVKAAESKAKSLKELKVAAVSVRLLCTEHGELMNSDIE
jgi:hypothetical protein